MKLRDFSDYKAYTRDRVRTLPKNGRGEFQRIATALGMHPTLVSQVFRGDKNLTLEQACELCGYWGLREKESEYFLALVQKERAGTPALREVFQRRIQILHTETQELSSRLPNDKIMSESERTQFYSSWIYSAVRLLCSIPTYQTIDAIADYFEVPKDRIVQVVDFLLQCGLCLEVEGRLTMGPERTYLDSRSPLISKHRLNWRLKAFEKIESIKANELMFSAPISISKKDIPRLKEIMMIAIEQVSATVKETDPDSLVCLNIDLFSF